MNPVRLRFGRWDLLGPLGHSAQSEVFRAQARDDAPAAPQQVSPPIPPPIPPPQVVAVAVKRLLPHLADDAACRASLRHEAAALVAVDGWPAPRLLALDAEAALAPLPHLVRSYIAGSPLVALRGAPLAVRQAAAHATLSALAALHGRGASCGDVAPGNVVVAGDGRAWLIDLGLADAPELAVRPPSGLATAGFASPEVVAGGRPDRASDVFAVAALVRWLWAQGDESAPPPAPATTAFEADFAALLMDAGHLDPLQRPIVARLACACPVGDRQALVQWVGLAQVQAQASSSSSSSSPLASAAEDRGEYVTGRDDDGACVVVDAAAAAQLLASLSR